MPELQRVVHVPVERHLALEAAQHNKERENES